MKKCMKCGIEKEKSCFSNRAASSDGLHPYCKVCTRELMKVYGESQSVKKRAKEWKKNNPDQVKIHAKKSYEKNRESRLQKTRIYNDANRIKINERQKKYYEKNKDKIREKQKCFLNTELGKKYSNDYYHRTKEKFDLKIKARNKLRYAIKVGKIMKPEICEKCFDKRKLHGHHEDYSKPLEVIWVCSYCHKKIHTDQGN